MKNPGIYPRVALGMATYTGLVLVAVAVAVAVAVNGGLAVE